MGRGENIAADDLFYGEVSSEDSLLLRAADAIREEDWPVFFELLRNYPDLQNNLEIIEQASSEIAKPMASSLFGRDDFSDWSIVSAHLAREVQTELLHGEPASAVFDFYEEDIIFASLASSGEVGDAAREYVSASNLLQITPRVATFAVSSNEENKQALLHPLARLVSTKLLAQSPGAPQHSLSSGFVTGEGSVLHLQHPRDTTRSVCGKSGYGYASVPYGAWNDAQEARGPERCPRCVQSAAPDLIEKARSESSLDGGEFLPWQEDEIFEIVQEVGFPSIEKKLCHGGDGSITKGWHALSDMVAEEMAQGLIEKSL